MKSTWQMKKDVYSYGLEHFTLIGKSTDGANEDINEEKELSLFVPNAPAFYNPDKFNEHNFLNTAFEIGLKYNQKDFVFWLPEMSDIVVFERSNSDKSPYSETLNVGLFEINYIASILGNGFSMLRRDSNQTNCGYTFEGYRVPINSIHLLAMRRSGELWNNSILKKTCIKLTYCVKL